MIAGSPGRPYGFIMQDTNLVHFTTAVNTFHKPEQGEDKRQTVFLTLVRQHVTHDGKTVCSSAGATHLLTNISQNTD